MLKLTKRSLFATVLMCSLSFASVSNFAYAEEKKSETQKVTDNKSVAEPPSGPNVKAEKKEQEIEAQTPASVNGKKVDGTGTVTDFTTSGSKAFYTISDKENNIFYLIIDLDKTQNNVYFLSDVKKSTLDGTATASKDGASVKPNIPNQKQTEVENTTASTKSASEKPKEESGNNSFLLFVLGIAAVGLVGYYFLVIKKKKNQKNKNEDEDEEVMEDDYYEDEKKKNNKED
ncbi:DUF4366 domain-containing protein [Bacillus thuringiensis]|nr:DUF4366 domain-containing protein [Bacillus thuringiensis]MED2759319.1 DUF4366 domain-containing protein [Bacillus thuringiensis]MED2771540.1 DUF4366 domain-containing protein [Bacillus thuringiensis]MED2777804.1 DUF4366 domain-containing protein [Bacillus thuringiensis]MED2784002.1 DUF4366 domain-containing protein [Bacillus thuringiensis]